MEKKHINTIISVVVILIIVIGAVYLLPKKVPSQDSTEVKPDTSDLTQIYQNSVEGLSLRYPLGFTVDEDYSYQNLGPGKEISGVKFTIPKEMTTGTNLSTDSYISVESIDENLECSAVSFALDSALVKEKIDNGKTYSYAETSDAAAGNRYDEYVYAIPGTNPCIAIRYFIHYGNIANYDPGTIKEFDKVELLKKFDSIRRTLVLNQ